MNIILVFPKQETAKSLKNVLRKAGYSVDASVSTVAQALQAASESRYFRHVHTAAKIIEISSFASGKSTRESGEAPPAAEEASRFQGSGTIGGSGWSRES